MYMLLLIPTLNNVSTTDLVFSYCCQHCLDKYRFEDHLLNGDLLSGWYNEDLAQREMSEALLLSIPSYSLLEGLANYNLCQMLHCTQRAEYLIYDHQNMCL